MQFLSSLRLIGARKLVVNRLVKHARAAWLWRLEWVFRVLRSKWDRPVAGRHTTAVQAEARSGDHGWLT
jgi:hypothetical protein